MPAQNKDLKSQIRAELLKARPHLSHASQNTYMSVLHTLARESKVESYPALYKILTNHKAVDEHLETRKSISAKKTLLSALVLLTQDERYRKEMVSQIQQTNDEYQKQRVSDHRASITLTFEDVKAKLVETENALKKSKSAQNYMRYLVCALMTGASPGIVPRRLEWASVKVKNYNQKTDNYMKGPNVFFNQYKTARSFGQQTVRVPSEVMKHVRAWLKINESDFLFVGPRGNAMTASQMSKFIGNIFEDSKVGIDVIRSVFITNKHQGLPSLAEMEESTREAKSIAEQMGHSFTAASTFYRKVDN
jgi:hypothetical protein